MNKHDHTGKNNDNSHGNGNENKGGCHTTN